MAENNIQLNENEEKKSLNFVQQMVADDLAAGKNGGRLNTRFPPEPNGYLHIGHAKAICMDFGVAEMFGGTCNLRFDDTNPVKEDTEYEQAIMRDIKWLGYDWGDRLYYASDYFQKLYDFAIRLIKEGKAYVDDQTSEQIAAQKGTPTTPGQESPFRNREVEENLDLFTRRNAGEFEEGSHVLRAKLDMASDNMHFRDPIMYRIILRPHWRTGDKWKVYPMYDFAHGQSDYFEGVTHSICTLEFVPHRPLYEKFVKELAGDKVDEYCPRQIEFNRLNLTYTVMSKRKLLQLVKENLVNGWDDPRMPTICGLGRRGFTPQSIKNFINTIGYTKFEALNDISLLEHAIREDLNKSANRVCAVLNPVKVVITNYPEDKVEMMEMDNNPEQENAGTHKMPFSREIYIEREDFMEDAPKKFFRMTPGKEVRLKGAYIIMCTGCTKDADGNITEIQCTYDPDTLSGMEGANRKVKGTLHWVSANHCKDAEVRVYDRLFAVENPSADTEHDFRELLNPDSLKVIENAKIEPFLAENAKEGDKFQFQRIGYFCVDADSTADKLVFNRTIGLKDSWSKQQKKVGWGLEIEDWRLETAE
ncbi:MAG: glutamine--tRNA ligase/YqeY domain fusion protein [Muribaculaceae bacterium]|nr:glutamine--tRNA ligase/YqeY domain fusion protein [Muribaculaceae bacterium]